VSVHLSTRHEVVMALAEYLVLNSADYRKHPEEIREPRHRRVIGHRRKTTPYAEVTDAPCATAS